MSQTKAQLIDNLVQALSFVGTSSAPANGVYLSATNQLSFATNTTERLRIDSAGQLEAVSLGSASAPTYSWTTDPNSGLYSPGADQVAISTGGTGRLFVNANGNIGIGLTPSSWGSDWRVIQGVGGSLGSNSAAGLFSINNAYSDGTNWRYANNGLASSYFQFNSEHIWNRAVTGTAGNVLTWLECARIDSSGRLGLGTSSPTYLLDAQGGRGRVTANGETYSLGVRYSSALAPNGNYWIGATNAVSPDMVFSNNAGNERMRLTDGGSLGIGTTSPVQPFVVSNGGAAGLEVSTTGYNSGPGVVGYNRSSNAYTPLAFDSAYQTFWISGGERARIDSSGRLLVGTSSTSSDVRLLIQGSSGGNYGVARICTTDTTPTDGADLGYLVFGDSAHSNAAWINAKRDGGTWSGSSKPTRLVFSVSQDGSASPTERLRLNNAGLFGTFCASGTDAFWPASAAGAGTSRYLVYGTHSATATYTGTSCFVVYTNGNVQNTNNSYGSLSDLKLKENIVNASSQWDDIKALQVRKYNFKVETGQQTHTQIGLIAQEVEQVSPGLVFEAPDRDADGNDLGTVTKSVNYSVLYMKAVKALQEAMERIETLEAKVAALEAA